MKAWRLLLTLICFQPLMFLLNIVVALFFSLFSLAPGLIALQFFNALQVRPVDVQGIWGWIFLLVFIQFAQVLVGLIWQVIEFTLKPTFCALLHKNMFQRILNAPDTSKLNQSSKEYISYFRDDVEGIVTFLGKGGLLMVMGMVFSTVISFIIMLQISFFLTLLVFLPLIGVVMLANVMSKRLQTYYNASHQATSQTLGMMREAFAAILAIKVGSAENSVIHKMSELYTLRKRTSLKNTFFQSLLDTFYDGITNLGTGLILLIAATAIRSGLFTVGDTALFVYNLGSVIGVSNMLGSILTRYKQTDVSLTRLKILVQDSGGTQLVEHSPVYLQKTLPALSQPVRGETGSFEKLQIEGLTATYALSEQGIEDITLTLPKGSFTVITGRIGSGKTTLLRAILGLLPAQHGMVRWNDQPIREPALFFRAPHVAYVPQNPRLFSETLRDNILLGLPEETVQLDAVLETAILTEDITYLEKGLETFIGPKGMKLSGGQVQRAAIARALARQADLLVFDDVSSALDVETEKALWQKILAQQDVTLLAVSHRLAALQAAHTILVLDQGKILAQGTFAELVQSCAEIQHLWQIHQRDTPLEPSLLAQES